MDDVLGLVATLMLWAFVRAAARPRSRAWPVLVFALGVCATLVKETGVLLVILGAVGLAIVKWRAGLESADRSPLRVALGPVAMLLAGAAGLLVAAAIFSLASGGFAPWWKAFTFATRAVASNEYVREYQTGSALYYARGLAILQPLPWLLGIVAALLVVARAPFLRSGWSRPGSGSALQSVAWYTLAFLLVACFYPQKNMRFLSPIYAPVALLAAVMIRAAWEWTGARLATRGRNPLRIATALGALLLLLSLGADVRRFADLFLRREIPDLATPWFTGKGPSGK
jgi:hypothetical protein